MKIVQDDVTSSSSNDAAAQVARPPGLYPKLQLILMFGTLIGTLYLMYRQTRIASEQTQLVAKELAQLRNQTIINRKHFELMNKQIANQRTKDIKTAKNTEERGKMRKSELDVLLKNLKARQEELRTRKVSVQATGRWFVAMRERLGAEEMGTERHADELRRIRPDGVAQDVFAA